MTDDDRDRVVDAFDAAVSYWHRQLDEPIAEHSDADRPDTARDYFEDYRGFDGDTIDEWRLGWAPGDGGLYEYLDGEGFDAETIAATGLFCEDYPTKELWRGRYVLPYFSADGRAEYAIARCTGSKGGGAAGYDGHSADFLAGKYAKVAHSRENVPLSEPILGLQTLEGADEVVVAEGIADAISATEAGYAVLSPVTKEFKREHFDAVVDAVDEHDIGRVYVVPDAEQAAFSEIDSDDVPDEPEHIYEAITQPAVAPGPAGGLRTANHLVEHDIDARVVELPRPSGGKVDLDDYIQNWEQPLGPVLRSAKPPQDHPKFDAATATQDTGGSDSGSITEQNSSKSGSSDGTAVSSESDSALFELGLGDVNSDLKDGYRGKNPLGHTGSSENYFVVNDVDGTLFAKDYKRPGNPTYNGLTYLLVEMEERPVEGPEGPLSPRETWVAWAEARKRGLLDCDDALPTKALEHVAREQDLYNFDALDADLSDEDVELPAKAHNRALWWVNNRWADKEDVDTDEDGDATSKAGRAKTGPAARTWEDVRYIYNEDKFNGRAAARSLLKRQNTFMTVEGTEELYVYNPDTGAYQEEIGHIKSEIYDGLEPGGHWSKKETDEIVAGLRQHNRPKVNELNGRDAFDNPHICLENCVLDLFTQETKDHSPDYYFTDRIPHEYDPDASTEPYANFLTKITADGRDADKKAMLEMVGHALTPDAHERGWKNFMVLFGGTDNGKSVFYDLVTYLLEGDEDDDLQNVMSVKLQKMSSNRFSKNAMYGSMANIAGEINGKKIRNTADIKDITGGDKMEIEPKGGESISDTMNTTLMFAANDPPIIGERDKEAIASRIVPIELPHTFVNDPTRPHEKQKKPEDELKEKLQSDEAVSGFLNLALEGISRLEDNNGDVSLPETHSERLDKYEKNADPMREFGQQCLENATDDYIAKDDITAVYKEFADARGYEISTNVHSTLHGALSGLPGLHYSQTRPDPADYSGTSLPLLGYDERKRCAARVTLTEEGLEYAEAAGLIKDEDEEEADTDEQPDAIAARDPQYDATMEVTVKAVHDGKSYRESEGRLEGPVGTYIEFAAVEDSGLNMQEYENKKIRLSGATLRTDNDGLLQAILVDDVSVEVLEEPDQASEDTTQREAATDGGESDDNTEDDTDGVTGIDGERLQRVMRTFRNCAKDVFAEMEARPQVQSFADDPDHAERLIEAAVEQGALEWIGDDSEGWVRVV